MVENTALTQAQTVYPNQFYRRKNRRRLILISVVMVGLIVLTVYFSKNYPVNAVLVPVIVLLSAAIYRWPVVGLFVTLALECFCETFATPDGISTYTILPLININQFTTLPISATPYEVILFGTVIAAVLKALRQGEWPDKSKTALIVLGFTFFVFFGYFFGVYYKKGDGKAALWEVRSLVYVPLVYYLTVFLSRDLRIWKTYEWIFSLTLTALSIITIWRFFALADVAKSGLYSESLNGLNHDNAILFVMLIMWCMVKIVFGTNRGERIAAALIISLPTIGIMISGRRAAFACLAATVIVFLAVLAVRHRKAFIIAIITIALVYPPYMVVFSNDSGPLGMAARAFNSSKAPVNSRDYSSDLYRDVEKANVQQTLKLAPLTGIGFGQQFGQFYPMVILDYFTFQFYTPHVQILWLWLKVGLFGWALFWLMISSSMFKLGQIIKYNKQGTILSGALLSGFMIVSTMVYSYIDLGLISVRLMPMMCMGAGLLEIGYRTIKHPVTVSKAIEAPATAADKELVAAS
ncbi:MAG TPA: O-antigen ligase family protein [Chloroflexia bacterium]|nr:O-antigen ligase family protein [Chloroflexia bacterium]